jgi:hypothetical protein
MIAVDTNILVYAHRRDSRHHAAAERCVRGLAEGTATWAVPWPCVHEFLAITTHPRIYDPASTIPQALAQLEAWCASPSLQLLHEGAGYLDRLRALMSAAPAAGPRVHDARIAALCLHNGVDALWSADRDLSRFPGLSVRNPLGD